jgi:hypothetical protein
LSCVWVAAERTECDLLVETVDGSCGGKKHEMIMRFGSFRDDFHFLLMLSCVFQISRPPTLTRPQAYAQAADVAADAPKIPGVIWDRTRRCWVARVGVPVGSDEMMNDL